MTAKTNKGNFAEYIAAFLKENSKTNLISKNDEKFLYEKHIIDSLGIENFFSQYFDSKPYPKTLLDIGTGGGFPSVPIAIQYPEIQVTALDSIHKKINAIQNIKQSLGLKNLIPICGRAENLTDYFDIITCRAVAKLDKICGYALPLLNTDGYFVAYKSQNIEEEIEQAKWILEKHNAQVLDIISYDLQLDEKFVRKLIIINKKA